MRKTLRIIGITLALSLFWMSFVFAQEKEEPEMMMGIIDGGDTIIHKNLEEIWVMPEKRFDNRREERRYYRYVKKVKKVYPYARLAGEMLREYEPRYLALKSESARRKMMKDLENELLDRYKDEMKKITISEGHILLKLIDRETSRTSYKLLKEFRGGFSAFFWQGVARLFGSNLKEEYDPYGEDRVLEEIVTLIEVGYL